MFLAYVSAHHSANMHTTVCEETPKIMEVKAKLVPTDAIGSEAVPIAQGVIVGESVRPSSVASNNGSLILHCSTLSLFFSSLMRHDSTRPGTCN